MNANVTQRSATVQCTSARVAPPGHISWHTPPAQPPAAFGSFIAAAHAWGWATIQE
jgi:hypothetical protein